MSIITIIAIKINCFNFDDNGKNNNNKNNNKLIQLKNKHIINLFDNQQYFIYCDIHLQKIF